MAPLALAESQDSSSKPSSAGTTEVDLSAPSSTESATAEISEYSEVDRSIADTPRELSVAPVGELLHPENAPAWINRPAEYEPNKTHRFVIHSVPSTSQEDVESTLVQLLAPSLANYVEEHLIQDDRAGWLLRRRLTSDFILSNLIDGPTGYSAEVTTSAGPMVQKWVQITVTPDQQQQIRSWYTDALRGRRAGSVVLAIGIVAGVLSVVQISLHRRVPTSASAI